MVIKLDLNSELHKDSPYNWILDIYIESQFQRCKPHQLESNLHSPMFKDAMEAQDTEILRAKLTYLYPLTNRSSLDWHFEDQGLVPLAASRRACISETVSAILSDALLPYISPNDKDAE